MDNTHTTRIVDHVRVRAGDIVPHELNPRTHTDAQKSALAALLKEIGFARSLLAYRLPDGRLKLIDGHLRQSMDPDATVDVEVLDVNDAEARALLLAIDPLAQLAGYDADTLAQFREITEKDSAAITDLWHAIAESEQAAKKSMKKAASQTQTLTEQFIVIITCSNEQEQLALLRRFKHEGLECTAKIA